VLHCGLSALPIRTLDETLSTPAAVDVIPTTPPCGYVDSTTLLITFCDGRCVAAVTERSFGAPTVATRLPVRAGPADPRTVMSQRFRTGHCRRSVPRWRPGNPVDLPGHVRVRPPATVRVVVRPGAVTRPHRRDFPTSTSGVSPRRQLPASAPGVSSRRRWIEPGRPTCAVSSMQRRPDGMGHAVRLPDPSPTVD